MNTKSHDFFFEHKIFRLEEFIASMNKSAAICNTMLNQHLKSGNVVRIKNGLYASIPPGADPHQYPVDPYAIISCLSKDSVIAYHSALQFHGLAYSMHFHHAFQSEKNIREFQFRDDRFKAVKYPQTLLQSDPLIFVDEIDHHGFMVRVASQERTLVDVLNKVNLSGGLEEVWRSLEAIQTIKAESVVEYALLLDNATTISKVGFFLQSKQKELKIPDACLDSLKQRLPKSVHYFDRETRATGKYSKEWKIVIPDELAGKQWEDIFDLGDL